MSLVCINCAKANKKALKPGLLIFVELMVELSNPLFQEIMDFIKL
jgi:hypothetical protein